MCGPDRFRITQAGHPRRRPDESNDQRCRTATDTRGRRSSSAHAGSRNSLRTDGFRPVTRLRLPSCWRTRLRRRFRVFRLTPWPHTPRSRATAEILPWPSDCASAPLNRRRDRSSRSGRTALNLSASKTSCKFDALLTDQRTTQQKAMSQGTARPKQVWTPASHCLAGVRT